MSIRRITTTGSTSAIGLTDKYKKKASTAFTENTVLALDSNGDLIPATISTANIVAITRQAVTASDSNYADNVAMRVDEIGTDDEFEVDVDNAATGGFVAGVLRALLDAGTVKAAAPTTGNQKLVIIKKVFVDTNKAIVKLVPFATNAAA